MGNKKSWLNGYCRNSQRGSNDILKSGSRLYSTFSLLARGRFKWENLPEGLKSEYIEKYLFECGVAGFFMDDKLGLLCLPITPSGNVNVFGEHLKYNAVGIGYVKELNIDEFVRIKANDIAYPTILSVNYYADMIEEIEKTMYMNLRQQKFPYILGASKTNELTMRNIHHKLDNFEDVIVVDERIGNGGDLALKVIETNAPYLLEKLQEHKNNMYNEFLTYLGLNNTNTDKKERMLVDEVNVNNGHILLNMELEFKNRKKACDEINAKFGTNIKVIKVIEELEVNFNGKVYARTKEVRNGID